MSKKVKLIQSELDKELVEKWKKLEGKIPSLGNPTSDPHSIPFDSKKNRKMDEMLDKDVYHVLAKEKQQFKQKKKINTTFREMSKEYLKDTVINQFFPSAASERSSSVMLRKTGDEGLLQ
jgi:hypothetical protein